VASDDEDADDEFMQVDPTQQADSSAIEFSFEDAGDDDSRDIASDEPVEFSVDDTCTNLTARFDQENTPHPRAPSSLQVAAAATPLTSNTMSNHALPSSSNTQNLPAPLDPQYTTDTGPAGARDP
jgi:hypothetical protein